MTFPVVTLLYFLIYPAAYFVLLFLFPRFFHSARPKLHVVPLRSVAMILGAFVFFFLISEMVTNEELSNRILHAFAGGFTAMLMCFYAARDSKVRISKFQFFFFSALLVTAMGVANEIAEFFGQNYTSLVFAPNINDTWLDLISNTVGILLGAAIFVPVFKIKDT